MVEQESPREAATVAVAQVLESATRTIAKATLVPLTVQASSGQAVVKAAFLRQLGLRPGEADAAGRRATDRDVDELIPLFSAAGGEDVVPPEPSALAVVPVDSLRKFGNAVVEERRTAAGEPDGGARLRAALSAVAGLEVNTAESPLGMLNLERLEMAPAGIERGELVATIPLAPLEETAVVEKEWSVQSKEFTSIVTDELEQISETGVTDNTELAQSTTSQQQHSNQFNITGTVSGGIPVISGSASSGFTSQDTSSQSATDSRKQATALTQKASARSKQEHKVTITTKSVVGKEEITSRKLRNPSDKDPIRIDYFSLMRKWRVRLYRYGLRMTYDVVVPEPGAAMRRTYRELAELKARLGPFVFPVRHAEITDAIVPGDLPPDQPQRPHYEVLADRYGAKVPEPPKPLKPYTVSGVLPNPAGRGINDFQLPLNVKTGHKITKLTFSGAASGLAGVHHEIAIVGTRFHYAAQDDRVYDPELLVDAATGAPFLEGATGDLSISFYFRDASSAIMQIMVETAPGDEALAQWRSDVWSTLYDAAQTRYYAEQQDIAAKIADIEERLSKVDTLTLRREESDEVMKSVIRFIAGEAYQYMDDTTIAAFGKAGEDPDHGIGFDANKLTFETGQFAAVRRHENIVRFINQAIEWENVVTFLYSYFWDAPKSWDFIRQIQHPDANRQAFMRAGSARVVLTVRKGWEERWLRFAESGFTNPQYNPDAQYLTIAREIAAYDDRNYPGIPPANAGRSAVRLADSVYTTSSASVQAGPNPVTIKVDSVTGFVVGARVLIGSAGLPNTQETQLVQAITGPDRIVVQRLDYPHDGSVTPFPVVLPGERGALIAEWNEYTPSSGTDIEVTSNLSVIS